MGAFVSEVPLRWSDMDAFGHLNHARTVTLLEEARAELLFGEAGRQGMLGMAEGMVVARVVVDYHTPVSYSAGTLQVRISVRELKAASFVLDYSAFARDTEAVATAETVLVPYDLKAGRPRRLTADETAFLTEWQLTPAAEEAGLHRA